MRERSRSNGVRSRVLKLWQRAAIGPWHCWSRFADKGVLVAVAGDFKRGKSTLLNALLGFRLLPTRVAPATAVPCLLRFAPELTVRVYYHDGRPSEVIPVRTWNATRASRCQATIRT